MNWVLANPTKSINDIGVICLEFNVLFHLFAAESVLFGGKRNRGHSRVSHHKLSRRYRFILLLFSLKENNGLFALKSKFHYAKSSVAEDTDYNGRIFLSAMLKARGVGQQQQIVICGFSFLLFFKGVGFFSLLIAQK
jgi:hypothetical protein